MINVLLTKVAKMFGDYLGDFENITYEVKIAETTLGTTFWKIWLVFLFKHLVTLNVEHHINIAKTLPFTNRKNGVHWFNLKTHSHRAYHAL